jgi:transposase-like protein
MGRPKGGRNHTWSDEERLRIVKNYLEGGLGQRTLADKENVPRGTLKGWIDRYMKDGEAGLKNKQKTGNLYAALHNSNTIDELERLKLIVMKQEIEIERLKKGYMVEGVGADKVFVTSKGKNTKSSKP